MNLTTILTIAAVVVVAGLLLLRRRAPANTGPAREPVRSRREQPMSRPLNTGTPRDLGTMASTSGRGGAVFPFTAEAIVPTAEMPIPQRDFPLESAGEATTHEPRAGAVEGERVQGARVEFHQPADGTLQFIPGRLEIVEGEDQQRHEIRFVKSFSGPTEVTFGRNAGEPYRHVQLHSQTVSRLHAKMAFANGVWTLTNLSETNPTILNSTPLAEPDGTRALHEGDTIEMGEVIFRFREK